MDRTGISQVEHIKITVLVIHDPAITKVDSNDRISLGTGNAGDIAHIAVIDVLAVLDLHNLIAGTEPSLAVYSVHFPFCRWIYFVLEPLIQCVCTCLRLLAVR